MAKPVNLIRNVNGILGQVTVRGYGKHWAIEENLDAYVAVTVEVHDAPADIKTYLEGNNELTVYPVPANVDKLCAYCFTSFPELKNIYILNYEDVIELESNWDATLVNLEKIYVPESLLSDYQTAYPNESRFDIIIENYTLTIPYVGNATLTTDYIDTIIAGLSSQSKNAVSKIVIDTQFTDYLDAVWAYNFSDVLPQLNNNIWYGTTKVNFSVYTIKDTTQDHILTTSVVQNSLDNISSSKVSLINKLHIDDTFADFEVKCLDLLGQTLSNQLIEITVLNRNNTDKSFDKLFTNFNTSLPNLVMLNIYYRGKLPNFNITITTLKTIYIKLRNGASNQNIHSEWLSSPYYEELIIDEGFTGYSSYNLIGLVFPGNSGNLKRVILPSTWVNIPNTALWIPYVLINNKVYLYINRTNGIYTSQLCERQVGTGDNSMTKFMFVKPEVLINYMESTVFAPIVDKIRGFFTYDGTLPTFTGYTDQWYSDEDCTIPIATTDFVSGNRYFVKLTAI